MDEVMVSVQCITYNHEKYIRKALDGFVMQKTNFKFEVIVHDDASTDATPQIIQEYAEKYDFIIPIFQSVNQYSQGIPFAIKYIYPRFRGKYIAYCEGDDYWTDSNKLQFLFDYMEKHPNCSMCCHAYENIEANSEKKIREVHTLDHDGTITIENAIMYNNPPQLASQMFKKECILNKPDLFMHRGVGDYTSLLYSAILGEMHYIDKVMAKHRIASDGSWTVRVNRNKEMKIEHDLNMISFLEDFNQYCELKYQACIYNKIEQFRFDILMNQRRYKEMINHKCFNTLSKKRTLLIILGAYFPKFINKILDQHDLC